ncbi:MAG: GFA family protein [Woeseiaceae bacterium]|nr:GFA family protein [Woeseiaceae bacterium]
MANGQCNCGAIRFEIAADISDVFVCHCSICRRSSGGNGIAVLVVSNDDFRWTSGQELITTWKKPDADWQTWFCSACGSRLPGINDETRMFVPAGLISEGGENLAVRHHIWVDSRACWDVIGDAGRQHREAFGR